MALFVDSAMLADIARLCETYPIAGVTMNPALAAKAVEQGQRLGMEALLGELLRIAPGVVLIQPTAVAINDVLTQSRRFLAADPQNVVIKLPMSARGLQAAAALRREGGRVAFTAVFGLPQAYCALQSRAEWIIPYFGRMRREGIDAADRVRQMARLAAQLHTPTRLLAASIKSPSDLIEATLAGADDVTAPPDVIAALAHDELSARALAQFTEDWQRAEHGLTEGD